MEPKFEPVSRDMYHEIGTRRFCMFYSVGGGHTVPGVAVSSGNDDSLSVMWLRGFRRGMLTYDRLSQYKTLFWLTPEQFFARGGKFDDAIEVGPDAGGG